MGGRRYGRRNCGRAVDSNVPCVVSETLITFLVYMPKVPFHHLSAAELTWTPKGKQVAAFRAIAMPSLLRPEAPRLHSTEAMSSLGHVR